jgi:hypothetical protein
MFYCDGNALRYKQPLFQIRTQQDAAQLPGTEHREFFVRKFEGHGQRLA